MIFIFPYNLKRTYLLHQILDLFCTHNKAIEISVFVSVWDNSAKLIFFEFTTGPPLTVIEPFQWLDYLELHRIQSIIPTTVGFLSFNACSCLVHVTLYHVSVEAVS
jgi:hypothetical protein